ncbi:Nif3-like dinuclear metal center hexameric protein [Candidatus Micrarchaeota archaeon CG_4_10_14_0_2_um_filter_60_11]|nr:MAG: Nif3-like dinuclear metal center hexameric protein [Candidatus Micrarchaeota archaeon CG1_02_60_51]PIZ91084.1 MAG: Nif3-like dinuclear metal center hexameric protein [Candidatus Micrarchaeota archaeon CG_4_10_14_0_2_um_filter_60_11]
MAETSKIAEWLDGTLYCDIEDDSFNGLQIAGKSEVKRVGLAVDACLETFDAASRQKCDLLLVHHGLFWKNRLPSRIDALWRNRLNACFESGLNLYAAHLPLDAHPKHGNNICIANGLGLAQLKPWARYHGTAIGFRGLKETTLERLAKQCETLTGKKPRVFNFGDMKKIRSVGVCSGGGGFAVAEGGVDVLVTGEFTHSNYHYAKENGVSVIKAGHYATETFGVRALGGALAKKFGLQAVFIDAPTGL